METHIWNSLSLQGTFSFSMVIPNNPHIAGNHSKNPEIHEILDSEDDYVPNNVSINLKLKPVHKIQKVKHRKKRYHLIMDDVRKKLVDAIINDGEKIKDVWLKYFCLLITCFLGR